jgi:alkylhydroperoxidase/carboxymuconolactone decarboxylase family protein YurZ
MSVRIWVSASQVLTEADQRLTGDLRHTVSAPSVSARGDATVVQFRLSHASAARPEEDNAMDDSTMSTTEQLGKLTPRQRAIAPVAALAAAGEVAKLGTALNVALDAGLGIAEIKEVLVQVYAYAGFPRSLNALGEFMQVVEKRRQQGIYDAPGQSPQRAIPAGAGLLAAGLANQTKLSGDL